MGERFRPPEDSYCDVVMKGGITSGVVYPKAICALADHYRFRNVGGTSAGAIAAAATAAAEYGRDREGGEFKKLEELPGWLGEDDNLIGLFQPQQSTRRLHGVLIASMRLKEEGLKKKLAALPALGPYAPWIGLGALPGLLIVAMLVLTGALSGAPGLLLGACFLALFGLLFAALGAVLGLGAALARDLNTRVVGNGFGLCSGMPTDPADPGGAPALTPWLHEQIEDCSGHRDRPAGRPLTFGDLWCAPGETWDATKTVDDRHLNLAMMTTNLVNRRAHEMPWDEDQWYFSPEEFSRLFPTNVVRHLLEHPRPLPGSRVKRREALIRRGLAWQQGLRPLPEAQHLPVLVATRMSLSFPILLTAVPLWRLDFTREDNTDALSRAWYPWGADLEAAGRSGLLEHPAAWSVADPPGEPPPHERCWFSDGGISSNFPVHFFDRLVPRRPTFAIDLRPFRYGREPSGIQTENVEMPKQNSEGIADWWYRFPTAAPRFFGIVDGRLTAFLGAAVKTMQNRVDEAQMRVPGYRDRVSHVNLAADEGGMNLNMDPKVIEHLTERGEAAAELLIAAYDPQRPRGRGISWRNHRWVRFRSSLAVLERMSCYFSAGVAGADYVSGPEPLIETADSYKLEDWQKPLAETEVERVEELAAAVAGARIRKVPPGMQFEAPKPPPVGRISPKE
ncbi:MAG TPA: hypothetical protein VJL81_08890 [Solirubrobacterales bacterium]|nr:hypothetical protein [Solirubrobacterales bacterium]